MANVVVFNGTPYCAKTLSLQAGRMQSFKANDIVVPLTVEKGPLTVYQFEGQFHLLMGMIDAPEVHAKVLSKHQLKHCRLEDVKMRTSAIQPEPLQDAWRRPYQSRPYEGRRY